jgi:hypothetical protein
MPPTTIAPVSAPFYFATGLSDNTRADAMAVVDFGSNTARLIGRGSGTSLSDVQLTGTTNMATNRVQVYLEGVEPAGEGSAEVVVHVPVIAPFYFANALSDDFIFDFFGDGTSVVDFGSNAARLIGRGAGTSLADVQLTATTNRATNRSQVYLEGVEPAGEGSAEVLIRVPLTVYGAVTTFGQVTAPYFTANGSIPGSAVAVLPEASVTLNYTEPSAYLWAKSSGPGTAAIQLRGVSSNADGNRENIYLECAETTPGNPTCTINSSLTVDGAVTAQNYIANGPVESGGDGIAIIDFLKPSGPDIYGTCTARFMGKSDDATLGSVQLWGYTEQAEARGQIYLSFQELSGPGSASGFCYVPLEIDGNCTVDGILTAQDGKFESCTVDGSPVLTEENLPPGGIPYPPSGVPVSTGSEWAASIDPATIPRLNAPNIFTKPQSANTFTATGSPTTPLNTAFSNALLGTLDLLGAGTPTLTLVNANADTDAKAWVIGAWSTDTLQFVTMTDAGGVGSPWMVATRNGTNVTGLSITPPVTIGSANATLNLHATGSPSNASFNLAAPGANNYAFGLWSSSNGAGLGGVAGFLNTATSIFPWSLGASDDIHFFTPISGGNVATGAGSKATLDHSGNLSLLNALTAGQAYTCNARVNLMFTDAWAGIIFGGPTTNSQLAVGMFSNANSGDPNIYIQAGPSALILDDMEREDGEPRAGVGGAVFRNADTVFATLAAAGSSFSGAITAPKITATGAANSVALVASGPSSAVQVFGANPATYGDLWVQTYSSDGSMVNNVAHFTATEVAFNVDVLCNYALTVSGSKNFAVPHPFIKGKDLIHSCLEGPEIAVFYRGEVVTQHGRAAVELPDYFEALTYDDDRSVLLTQIVESDKDPLALVAASRVVNGGFWIMSSDDVRVAWEVKAVRRIGVNRLDVVRERTQ